MERPPALDDYFLNRDWSIQFDLRTMSAAYFYQIRAARNVFEAMRGYNRARDSVAWTRDNPESWELLNFVFDLQAEAGVLD